MTTPVGPDDASNDDPTRTAPAGPYPPVDYPDQPPGYPPPPPYPGGGPPAYPGGPAPYPGGPPPYPTGPSPYPGGPPPYPGPPLYPAGPAPYPGGPPPYPTGPSPYPGGVGYGGYQPYGSPRGTSGLAIASLICSVAGIITCGVASIVGIVLGFVAMQQIKQTGQEGRGLALAGVISGAVIIVLVTLYWIGAAALAHSVGSEFSSVL